MELTQAGPHGPGDGPRGSGAVPRLADGVELIGEMSHSGFREPPALVRRADGQVLQLTELLYRTLSAIDGERDTATIAGLLSSVDGRRFEADDVEFLIEEKLRPLGLLVGEHGRQPALRKSSPLLALHLRQVVSAPGLTRALTVPFLWLFNPLVIAVVVTGFVGSVAWLFGSRGVGLGFREMLYEPRTIVLVVGLTALSAAFHELGHAAACRYGGASPGAMGAGIYIVWPAFYTDVTDSYRLDRAGRLRVDLGGLYFNCVFTVITVATWWRTGWEPLLVLVPLQLVQMAHQLPPLLRLDGYHILADLTGVPDLFARIRPTLASLRPGAEPDERVTALRPRVRVIVTAWVALVVPILALILGAAVMAMPRLLATALDSIGQHADGVVEAWLRGQPWLLATGALAVAATALPILGVVAIVTRIAMRAWRALWERVRHPAGRAVLVAIGALVLAFASWALWPDDDYRPLERGERLTFTELAATTPLGDRGVTLAASGPRGTTEEVGVRSRSRAGVRTGSRNAAIAINLDDWSSLFRLAFSIHQTAGSIDTQNTAIALASCRECTTVALALQVVLAIGEVGDAAPRNVAIAANVRCSGCLTYASATQLVLSFVGPVHLTEAGNARLAAVEQRLAGLAGRARSLTRADIDREVEAAKAELAAIFRDEVVVEAPPAEGSESDGAEATSTTTTQPDSESTTSSTSTSSSSSTSTSTSTTTAPAGGAGTSGDSTTSTTSAR